MNRSSSRKDLRAERLGGSPYSRPERGNKKQGLSRGLGSFMSLVSSKLGFSTAAPRDEESRSVSGSEDEWNGEPPSNMKGQDVFSLAAAAGRDGDDFERRAATWREGKSILGASTRNAITSSKSSWGLDLADDTRKTIRPSPSMPTFQQTPALPKGSGLLFTTPAAQRSIPEVPSSAPQAALRAFMQARGDQPLAGSDIQLLESMVKSMRAESTQPTGGWSAAIPSPAPTTPLRASETASTLASPSSFSVGRDIPSFSSTKPKVTYLGPGMSPRRAKPRASLRALNLEPDSTQAGKKRRTETSDAIEVEEVNGAASPLKDAPTAEQSAAATKAAMFNSSRSLTVGTSASAARRPSPLSQSTLASPQSSVSSSVKTGKKRAQDILRDVIEAEIGPAEPEKPDFVFNPYEEASKAALPSGKLEASRSSLRRSASAMRLSARSSTATRGAAARLEQSKGSGRKLTTLEMVSGYKSQKAKSSGSTPATSTPEVDDSMEVEEEVEEPPSPPKRSPPKSFQLFKPAAIPQPESFKALPPPSHLSSSVTQTSHTPVRKAVEAIESATTNSILAASQSAPAPVFKPTPVSLGPPPSRPAFMPSPSRPAPKGVDPQAIFFSAKDSALNVDKAALPFFTFTLPSSSSGPSNEVKAEAKKRSLPVFTFTMAKPSLSAASLSPTISTVVPETKSASATTTGFTFTQPGLAPGEWECSQCMLTNPASATEKCTICDAPRSGASKTTASTSTPASSAAPTLAFKQPALADGEWECNTCMLKNPATATEKCTVCDAAKPGPTKTASKAQAPTLAPAPSTGFTFKQPGLTEGEWECDTCMLKNPASATEKCTVCDAKKPGAASASAAAPAALPSAPAGGFSFKLPAAAAGEWTCDTCMLQNPESATDKCTVCDAPRPGASAKAASASNSAPAPPSAPAGGFSFGGKPFSAPAPPAAASGGFSFGGKPVTTTLPAAPATSVSFGAPSSSGGFKPAGFPAAPSTGFSFGQASSSSSAPAAGGFTPSGAAPSGGFTFGSAAPAPAFAGFTKAPPADVPQWTCDTCMLQNPDSAQKCTVCDADRP